MPKKVHIQPTNNPASEALARPALEWAKPATAAKIFGLGRTTLYSLISEKRVKSAKVGKARLVSVASLRAYIEGLADSPPAGRRINIRQHVG
jgi:excisionase family DNA binding protein